MNENEGGKEKVKRTLSLYARLMDGEIIRKSEEALRYGVNERSIQRDIDDIRIFLSDDVERTGIINDIVYDRDVKGFRLEKIYQLKLLKYHLIVIKH